MIVYKLADIKYGTGFDKNARFVEVEDVRPLVDILQHLCEALDMSDPGHDDFADSGADVVQHLWLRAVEARSLLKDARRVIKKGAETG
jgi:hypothetical protein